MSLPATGDWHGPPNWMPFGRLWCYEICSTWQSFHVQSTTGNWGVYLLLGWSRCIFGFLQVGPGSAGIQHYLRFPGSYFRTTSLLLSLSSWTSFISGALLAARSMSSKSVNDWVVNTNSAFPFNLRNILRQAVESFVFERISLLHILLTNMQTEVNTIKQSNNPRLLI